jgi:hypothetical protein
MDLKAADTKRKILIDDLEEWREKAHHNAKLYKERIKRWHDKQINIKYFKPGDKVLLFNSHIHLFGHGTLTLHGDDGDTFKVNGQCLKLFLEPNPHDFVEVDVLDFLKIE